MTTKCCDKVGYGWASKKTLLVLVCEIKNKSVQTHTPACTVTPSSLEYITAIFI